MNEKNFQQEKSAQEEKSNILTLILSSILLHLLIMLAIIFYRFEHEESYEIPRMSPHDQAVLWTNPPAQMSQQMPTQAKQEPKKQEQPKQEPKQPEFLKPLPKITPGKQGIDQQDFKGDNQIIQSIKSSEKKQEEPKAIPKEKLNQKEEIKTQKEATPDTLSESGKKLLHQTADIIRQDPEQEKKFNSGRTIVPSQEKQESATATSAAKKKEIVFDTDLDFLGKKTLLQKLIEKDEKYENVPSAQTKKTKSISYKDIGLGFSNAGVNVGNSANLMIQGSSPDIPQGDELKYITYLNQMVKMIVSSMHSNSQINLIPRYTGETVICHMKVTREGQLLNVHIVRPSRYEIINIFIVESIKQVGLFNQLPKFINKETFEINWHILT
jgi:hypothetical protein